MSLPGTQGSEEEGPGHRLQGAQGGPFAPIDLLPSAPACDPTRPLTPSTWPRSLLPGERRMQKLCAARGSTLPSFSPRTMRSGLPRCRQPPCSLPTGSRLPLPRTSTGRGSHWPGPSTHGFSHVPCVPSCHPVCPRTESPPPPPIKAAPGTHHPPRAWLACVLPETAPAGRCPEAGLSRGDRAP